MHMKPRCSQTCECHLSSQHGSFGSHLTRWFFLNFSLVQICSKLSKHQWALSPAAQFTGPWWLPDLKGNNFTIQSWFSINVLICNKGAVTQREGAALQQGSGLYDIYRTRFYKVYPWDKFKTITVSYVDFKWICSSDDVVTAIVK